MIPFELYHVKKEQAYLQQDVKIYKDRLAEANNIFQIEIKRDDNLKAFFQPVRAKMGYILYDHGIDKRGTFGDTIDGNDCHRLISDAESIFGELVDFFCI